MKQLIPVFSACLLAACNTTTVKQAAPQQDTLVKTTTSTPPHFQYGDTSLLAYDQYLHTLDSLHLDNVTAALHRFQLSFAHKPATICDTAFYLFDQFHKKMLDNPEVDAGKLDSLQMATAEDTKTAPTREQKLLAQQLQQNGITIETEEGTPYPAQDQAFLLRTFSRYLSPVMQQYLVQLDKEQKEGYQNDAGLIISAETLASRTAWWEAFNREHPDFLYNREAHMAQEGLINSLLMGMDNTPVLNGDSLDSYFRTAYEYLRDSVPAAEITRVTTGCLHAYDKADTATANKIINTYQQQHETHVD